MANNTPDCAFPSPRFPAAAKPLEGLGGYRVALALSMAGALAAAVFILAHWSVALVAAIVVLALSAAESEPFLLFVIFLTPLSLSLFTNGSRHDLSSAIHWLTIIGFFFGRLWRGRLDIKGLLRSTPARASLWFLGAIMVSMVLGKAAWTRDSAHSLYTTGSYIGFFFLIVAWADSPSRVRKLLSVLLYSTIITAFFAILQELVGGYTSFWLYLNSAVGFTPEWIGRATSFLGYSNSLAGYINLVLPFALACFVRGRGKWRNLGGWTIGLGILALLSAQSVGGLGAFVSILVLAIFYIARNRLKSLVLLASICTLVGVIYFLKPYLNPTHTAETIGPDAIVRLLLWSTAWGYFVHSPMTGVGWGNFVGLYGPDLSSVSDLVPAGVFEVHNIYLQLLAETGLIGFLAFFYLFLQSWRLARSQLGSSVDFLNVAMAFGVLGALLSVLVHGFVDFLFLVSPQFGTLFWILLALLVASSRPERNSLLGQKHTEKVG